MKGVIFGYRQVSPCPRCGTQRVGIDADDDYYIVPGLLQESEQAGELEVRWGEVRPGDVVHTITWNVVRRVEPHPRGVLIGFDAVWDYVIRPADAPVRVQRTEQRRPYEPLPGCEACNVVHTNPYAPSS